MEGSDNKLKRKSPATLVKATCCAMIFQELMALSGSGQRAKVGAKLEGGRAKDPYMGCHKRCEEGQKRDEPS